MLYTYMASATNNTTTQKKKNTQKNHSPLHTPPVPRTLRVWIFLCFFAVPKQLRASFRGSSSWRAYLFYFFKFFVCGRVGHRLSHLLHAAPKLSRSIFPIYVPAATHRLGGEHASKRTLSHQQPPFLFSSLARAALAHVLSVVETITTACTFSSTRALYSAALFRNGVCFSGPTSYKKTSRPRRH